jgi:hypothetical protein
MKIESAPQENLILRGMIIFATIVLAAALRISPHPWNFTPVGAMALFSGAVIRDPRFAFLFPLLAMFAGDIFIGWHKLTPVVYASFLLSVAIGRMLQQNRSIVRIGGVTLLGALQFFVITNLGVWAFLGSFPHSVGGLLACYIAGSPFFWNTLAGDALYATLLFGGFALVERLVPSLRRQPCRGAL